MTRPFQPLSPNYTVWYPAPTMPRLASLVKTSRRAFLVSGLPAPWLRKLGAAPKLRVTGMELLPIRATGRTVWLVVRLTADQGLTGLGEASDAATFAMAIPAIALIAVVACSLPTWRASRLDPNVVLRSE